MTERRGRYDKPLVDGGFWSAAPGGRLRGGSRACTSRRKVLAARTQYVRYFARVAGPWGRWRSTGRSESGRFCKPFFRVFMRPCGGGVDLLPAMAGTLECWQTQKAGSGFLGLLSYCVHLPHDFEGGVYCQVLLEQSACGGISLYSDNTARTTQRMGLWLLLSTQVDNISTWSSAWGAIPVSRTDFSRQKARKSSRRPLSSRSRR